MEDVLNLIRTKTELYAFNGASHEEIIKAERVLKTKFAEDYNKYIEKFGEVSFENHELTGICVFPRLNVVDVTLKQRKLVLESTSWYVIEEANIDGIVIWQDSEGNIYQTAPGLKPEKIADNLAEYIMNCK